MIYISWPFYHKKSCSYTIPSHHHNHNANAGHEAYSEHDPPCETKMHNIEACILLQFVIELSYLLFIFDPEEVGWSRLC